MGPIQRHPRALLRREQFAWRKRLGYDGRLVSELTRIFVKTVLGFYRERGGPPRGQSGAVVAVQPASSDLKLNPHVHAVFLDGAYREKSAELDFRAVGHLSTRGVAAVLERTRGPMVKWLRRRGLLLEDGDAEGEGDGRVVLAASAVAGTTPPAGPERHQARCLSSDDQWCPNQNALPKLRRR